MSIPNNKHFVYVNSRNRIAGTDANFTYNIDFPPDRKFDHVVLLEALIPKSYWLVQTGYNLFALQENNQTVQISVPTGCYALAQWMNQISALLTSASPNGWVYTVTYPSLSNPAVLNEQGQLVYTVTGNSSQPSLIFDTHCVLYEPMGFQQNSVNVFSNNTLQSTCVIKMQSEDRLMIHSNCVNNPGQMTSLPLLTQLLVSITALSITSAQLQTTIVKF
jgi:hypothetical protein